MHLGFFEEIKRSMEAGSRLFSPRLSDEQLSKYVEKGYIEGNQNDGYALTSAGEKHLEYLRFDDL